MNPVARPEYPPETVRNQLERVLVSPGFARNERLSRFLRVVVERHLEGRDCDLKESVIGIEVFGRKPGYDPKQDSTVRSEAGRLRARLLEYYAGKGIEDPVIIELPKGGYTPAFHHRENAPEGSRSLPSPPGPRRGLMIAWAAFAIALAVVGWRLVQQQGIPISIAVLPLKNLSQGPASDYFTDGLTGEIIRNLSIIEGLAVRSQTSSFALKGNPPNIREAGKQLAADYILEGSVFRAGQHLRIDAQLVRVRDDIPLWSGRFDRELADVLAIQDEISRGIVNNLRLKLGRGRRRYETSVEAYDLYLRARAFEIHSGGLPGFNQSIDPYRKAIVKDPSFAPAYAGLAAAYAYRSGTAYFDMKDELAKMRAAAEKAIELDPLSAEAHAALGIAYARDAQWRPSGNSFRHAIELDPNRSESYSYFAMYLLMPLGRIEEALLQVRIAEKTDPLSPKIRYNFAYVLLSAGRYEEAADHCQKLPADYRPYNSECLGRARLGQGRTADAVEIFETAVNRGVPEGAPIRGYLGYAYARAGRREQAEKIAAATSSIHSFHQALTFAGLGDTDRAMQAAERMVALGPMRIGRDLNLPALDS